MNNIKHFVNENKSSIAIAGITLFAGGLFIGSSTYIAYLRHTSAANNFSGTSVSPQTPYSTTPVNTSEVSDFSSNIHSATPTSSSTLEAAKTPIRSAQPRVTASTSTPSAACVNTSIARGNTYVDDPSLLTGQTETHQGSDGTQISCPGAGGFAGWTDVIPPVNNTVYKGTREPVQTDNSSATAAAYNAAVSQCSNLGGSAVQVCMAAHGF